MTIFPDNGYILPLLHFYPSVNKFIFKVNWIKNWRAGGSIRKILENPDVYAIDSKNPLIAS